MDNYNKANMEVYQMYLDSNKARNYETVKTTYRVYSGYMKQYMKYLQKYEGNRLLLSDNTIKYCVPILERFINFCREQGNNNQTINNKLTAISSFYIWCVKRDLINHHPFQHKLDRLKKGEFDKRRKSYYLSFEEIVKARILMEHNYKDFDIQSRFLWEIFLDSGKRISAIQSLKISQLNLKGGYFTNVREKGNKIVDVIFLDKAEQLLTEWLEYRKNNNIISDYIFVTKENGEYRQMAQSTMRVRIRKIGELIGYDKLYPHTLRKTAINMMKILTDSETATDFAGHSDPKTTKEHYFRGITTMENKQKILQARREKGLL